MKKIKVISLLLIIVMLCQYPVLAFETQGGDDFAKMTGLSDANIPVFANKEELSLDATAVILVERSTGEVMYEKNADEPRAIASITKIMTLILVMEAIESGKTTLEDNVNISVHAMEMGGSQIWLEPGEIFTVNELLKAVAVASANDAAVALAEHVAGSEEAFVAMMNQKALELGMTKTTFKNSNGLDEEGHMSCASDVAIMSREVLKHELVRNYITIWMDSLRDGETQLVNTNKMLKYFSGISGIKTGTTGNAGVCVSASAIRNDMELIAVVLGSSDSKSRFASASTLLEYGFANYELAQINVDSEQLLPIKVTLGEEEFCELCCDVPKSVLVEKGKVDSVSWEVILGDKLAAPVEQNQILGEINVYCDGELIGSYPVSAEKSVARLDFKSGIAKLLDAVFTM